MSTFHVRFATDEERQHFVVSEKIRQEIASADTLLCLNGDELRAAMLVKSDAAFKTLYILGTGIDERETEARKILTALYAFIANHAYHWSICRVYAHAETRHPDIVRSLMQFGFVPHGDAFTCIVAEDRDATIHGGARSVSLCIDDKMVRFSNNDRRAGCLG